MNNPELTVTRRMGLEKNFKLMFAIQAFQNVRLLNIVSVLFYLHRGLTLAEVFYLSVVFGIVNVLFEVPSSYLADKWGRKKTLILAVVLLMVEKIVYFTADSFTWMIIAITGYALSYALFTGTDDALIYDSARELGVEKNSLSRLGIYYSAQRVAKAITPLVGAIIARDLLEWQFQALIWLDLISVVAAFFCAWKITEPHHKMDVEKIEVGVFKDALKLIRKDPLLLKIILSRTLVFTASFVVWRVNSKYFTDIGLSLIALAAGISIIQAATYVITRKLTRMTDGFAVVARVNQMNAVFTVACLLFAVLSFVWPNPWVMLLLYMVFNLVEPLRWPFYSEMYNKRSNSFNRATTLSISNFIKSVLDVPILLVGAWLASANISYLFTFAATLAVVTVIWFKIPKHVVTETI